MENCSTCAPKPFSIFLGDAKTMPMKLVYQQNGNPFDLTDCTEIVVNIQNTDGSYTQLKLSLTEVAITSPPTNGRLTDTITSEESALLNVGENQNVDVTFTISSNPMTVRFWNALSVFEVD
jgi:hypothetical protein